MTEYKRCCECKYFELESTGGYEWVYLLLCSKFKEQIGYRIYLGWEDDSSEIKYKEACEHFEKDENKKGEWWL